MKRGEVLLLVLLSIITFLFVYSPHFDYHLPYHIDEWHHITEASKLREGDYSGGSIGFRAGFHVILMILSYFVSLISVYEFLPAIWAVVSGLILFFVTYKKTRRFSIAIFSMLFFATIKSNVNLTGLWFFTPLVFSIPFIFLYFYFFTEGLEKKNKRYIYISLAIMIFLLFIHSISVLFALPILIIYSLMHLEYIKRNYKMFGWFLLIPLIGLLFYKLMVNIPFSDLLQSILNAIQFKKGWGVLELNNSFLEIYSLVGYVLAVLGAVFIFTKEEKPKKYAVFVIWPIILLISIFIYRLADISYLSPYQRNLYYFAISLPILSAFGLYHLIKLARKGIDLVINKRDVKRNLKIIIAIILILLTAFLAFKYYYAMPKQIALYKLVDERDLQTLEFMKDLPKSRVMASPEVSTVIYPLANHDPVATISFYGNRGDLERFFYNSDCKVREEVLNKYSVRYVISQDRINCGWRLIYKENNFIYER
ncbi:MAG: hypothetical protein Q8Q31_00030 [Nanoarchaeota archaeon]|nr:hypothetical protein [Nanoarchaeota archaeon]